MGFIVWKSGVRQGGARWGRRREGGIKDGGRKEEEEEGLKWAVWSASGDEPGPTRSAGLACLERECHHSMRAPLRLQISLDLRLRTPTPYRRPCGQGRFGFPPRTSNPNLPPSTITHQLQVRAPDASAHPSCIREDSVARHRHPQTDQRTRPTVPWRHPHWARRAPRFQGRPCP